VPEVPDELLDELEELLHADSKVRSAAVVKIGLMFVFIS
jgi:hypothetical protein